MWNIKKLVNYPVLWVYSEVINGASKVSSEIKDGATTTIVCVIVNVGNYRCSFLLTFSKIYNLSNEQINFSGERKEQNTPETYGCLYWKSP